ncbi:MAG: hypothetical protein LBS96_08880 [Oscillospiraceae bacterium]|jgi:hypothetical protein|nr:hypothetical protein [Oscillospiraceae bacterium]
MKKCFFIASMMMLLLCFLVACADLSGNSQTEQTSQAQKIEDEDPFHFYTVFPLTTRIAEGIQNALYGGVVGKTSLEETERLLNKRKISYRKSASDSSIFVGHYVSYKFDEMNILESILVYWYEYAEAPFTPEMVEIVTDRGAKMGDSMKRIVDLYGDGYQKRDWQGIDMEYTDGNAFMLFHFALDEDGQDYLFAWFISSKSSFKEPSE